MLRRMLAALLSMCLFSLGMLSFPADALAEETIGSQARGEEKVERIRVIPYNRTVPEFKGSGGVQLTNFEIDQSKFESEGKLSLLLYLTKNDWSQILNSMHSLTKMAALEFHLTPPAGAVSYALINTNPELDESLAESLLHFGEESWQKVTDDRPCDVIIGNIVQQGNKYYVEPVSDRLGIMIAWKDAQGEFINLAPEGEEESYVEFLRIYVTHDNEDVVEVQSPGLLPASCIKMNAGNLEADFFVSPPEYNGKSIEYYIDQTYIQKKLDRGESIGNLETVITLPDGAKILEVKGAEVKDDRNIYCSHALVENSAPLQGAQTHEISIVWQDSQGMQQCTNLELKLNGVGDKLWMDMYWDPVPLDRIQIDSAFDGSNGVKIEMIEDGHAYCSFSNGKEKNYSRVVTGEATARSIRILIPEFDGKRASACRIRNSSGASIYAEISLAEEQRDNLDTSEIIWLNGSQEVSIYASNIQTMHSVQLQVGNKLRQNVYYPDSYGSGADCAAYFLVDWLDEKENVLSSEYLYYMVEEREKPLGNMGVNKKDLQGKKVEQPTILQENAQLLYEEPMQEKVSGQANGQCVLLDMADEEGNILPPSGEVEVILPYPTGISYAQSDAYTFTLQHYESEADTKGKTVSVTPTENGLLFATKDFSPFLLIWETKTQPQEEPESDRTGSLFVEPDYYPQYEERPESVQPEEAADIRYVLCSRLNLRKGPGTEFSSMDLLPRGTVLTVRSEENGWAKVVLMDGREGYVSAVYILGGTWPKAAVTTARNLNVRQGPGTEYEKIGLLPRGTKVSVLGVENDFCKIAWEEKIAYLSLHYLTFES